MAGIRIIYDTTLGGIRIVKAVLMDHTATFTCNEALGHCTVQVAGNLPLSPDISYVNGRFLMTYSHMSVTPETEAQFEAAYAAAKAFCHTAGPDINRVRAAIEDRKPIIHGRPVENP